MKPQKKYVDHKLHLNRAVAYIVMFLLSFLCLFFFYILIDNATHNNFDIQKGFQLLPGGSFLTNLKNTILCHANIRGPFLSDARLAGAFCSSTTELVRGVCRRLVAALRQPSAPVRDCALTVPVSYCRRGTAAYEALCARHYRLT